MVERIESLGLAFVHLSKREGFKGVCKEIIDPGCEGNTFHLSFGFYVRSITILPTEVV